MDDDHHVKVTVQETNNKADGIASTTSSSCCSIYTYYKAKNLVLALGNDEPSYPEWATKADIEEGIVHHLLDHHQQLQMECCSSKDQDTCNNKNYYQRTSAPKEVAIIGGGITAAHKALELVKNWQHGRDATTNNKSIRIHMISRHSIQEQRFDTHQDWMMDRAAIERSLAAGGSGMPKR